MSQSHGDVSGARPTQDYSACENSLTHITFGGGPSIQQYPHPATQHYHQHAQDPYRNPEESKPPGPGAQLPAGTNLFGGRSGLNGNPYYDSTSLHTANLNSSEAGEPACFAPGPAPTTVGDSQASPQDYLLPPQVYDNSMMLKEQDDHEDNAGDDPEDREGGDFDDGGDGNSQGSGKRSRTRRPHLQGRFSGRLTTKEDERRLAEECKLLGPLLGGVGKRGDKSRLTLAKIVRGIATGDVRRFCEERERAIGMLKAKLAAIDPDAAASVPVNAIPLPSSMLGPMGSLGPSSCSLGGNPSSMGMGGMGMGMSLGGMGGGRQVEVLQRENSELQHEVHTLRMELQARERLLLELQDTGIISGFVPTSIPLEEPNRMMPQPAAPMSGLNGGGGRSHSTDMPPTGYGLPPRHQSYTQQQQPQQQQQQQQHVGSYGGPSQMHMPQSSAHVSGGMEPGPMGGAMGMGYPLAQQQAGPGLQTGGGGGLGSDSASLGAVPAMSEHSRAGRPLKRPAIPDLGPAGGGGGGSGGFGEVARSLSHPPLGRSVVGFPHIDLQQQLSSLQAQVEHLQNLSQTQASRSAASYLMPARERSGLQLRMAASAGVSAGAGGGGGGGGGGQMHFGGGAGAGGIGQAPFMSSGPQGGLLMLPGHHQSEGANHPYHNHPGIGAPLQLQVVKTGSEYDDSGVAGGGGGRDPRNPGSMRHGGDGGYGSAGGGGGGLDATLEHMINSRAMRGEYDLPLELLLPEAVGKGGGPQGGPH